MAHLTLTQVQTIFGLPLKGEFIVEDLMIDPVATDKRAKFFSEEQLPEIRDALLNYVSKRDLDDIPETASRPAPKKAAQAPAVSPAQKSVPFDEEDNDEL